jgi:hypothetical protein
MFSPTKFATHLQEALQLLSVMCCIAALRLNYHVEWTTLLLLLLLALLLLCCVWPRLRQWIANPG